jgi:hypothetical protein
MGGRKKRTKLRKLRKGKQWINGRKFRVSKKREKVVGRNWTG